MRVPIISKCDANSEQNILFPAINSQTKIEYNDAKDGANLQKWNVDKVTCYDTNAPHNDNGIFFELKEPVSSSWEIVCTDDRITFWSPYTYGFLGKGIKQKPNKCSAGHLYFRQIGGLNAGFINGMPFFAVSCWRKDGTISNIMIFDKNIENLRELAVGVHSKLTDYLKENGISEILEPKGDRDVSWFDFPNLLWKNPSKDLRTNAHLKSLERVPNSQLG